MDVLRGFEASYGAADKKDYWMQNCWHLKTKLIVSRLEFRTIVS
jgi:hypothetical protein